MDGNNGYTASVSEISSSVVGEKTCIDTGNVITGFGVLLLICSCIFSFGPYLFGISYATATYVMYSYVALIAFEGFTNIKVMNVIISMFTANSIASHHTDKIRVKKGLISAERAWRLFMSMFIGAGVFFESYLWFVKWFVGLGMIFSGFSNICIISMFLIFLGFSYDYDE